MTKRRVRPDELELWQQIARSTERLAGKPQPLIQNAPSEPVSVPARDPQDPDRQIAGVPRKFTLGEKAKTSTRMDLPKSTSQRISEHHLKMDAKTFAKMKRGKLVPEGKIDLHGLTLDQAHGALNRFIMTSQSRGLRLVLVITGKGGAEDPFDPVARPRGVLKRQVPQWLRMAPLAMAVLQVAEASRRHGGQGAYYVYLRRR